MLLAVNAQAANFDVPFLAHSADGTPYWVVLCTQADECFEDAYRHCEGPYIPLDKQFLPAGGFRFVCKHPKKQTPPSALQNNPEK